MSLSAKFNLEDLEHENRRLVTINITFSICATPYMMGKSQVSFEVEIKTKLITTNNR